MFRTLLLLGVVSPVLFSLAPARAADAGPDVANGTKVVVVHDGDLALRSRIQRASVLIQDCGDFLIVLDGSRLRHALEGHRSDVVPLSAIAPDEQLFVVELPAGENPAALSERGARVLFRRGEQVVVAAVDGSAHRFRGLSAGRSFHGGATRVRSATMAPPRPFVPPGGSWTLGVANPVVQGAVDAVDQNELEQHVLDLSAIFTRCASGSGAVTARDQIVSKLQSYGYTPTLQDFSGSYSENVVAELPGSLNPDRIVVVGAHYDSIASSCSSLSPGADDNATGTAGVLEAARVLAGAGPFENTIRFILFSAEELGLIGSDYASGLSLSSGEDIVAMLNTDMSAYRAGSDVRDVDFVLNNSTPGLITYCDTIGDLYVPNWASRTGTLGGGTSDHQSYFTDGFPAIFYFEDTEQYSPYIHTSNDSHPQSTNDFVLSRMIVQGIVAASATLADPLDLTISHTPLGDSQSLGPYTVVCQVASQTGSTVTSVDLHYAVEGGTWTTLPMTLQGSDWSAEIPGAGSPVTHEYYITAVDDQGGQEDLPNDVLLGKPPFSFFVGELTVHHFNDFEAANDQGWTHGQVATQDDWQRGAPNGAAGDPASAWSGAKVWGNDLGGSGFNGEYQPDVENWLRSPVIDLAHTSSVLLQYRRWLTVEDGLYDQAQIRVNGTLVWQNFTGTPGNDTNHTLDSSWTKHSIDISALAAGNPAVQVEYRLISDGGLQFGGWNIDDFSLVSEEPVDTDEIGTLVCSPAVPNSTGQPGIMAVTGSAVVADDDLTLTALQLPTNSNIGYFIMGTGTNTFTPPGSIGPICVAPGIKRFLPPVNNTNQLPGGFSRTVGTSGPVSGNITPGSTWAFQAWHRDSMAGTSNLTDAISVDFQ